MVYPDGICCERAILVRYFRYEDRYSSIYWNKHLRSERRALLALGRFVPYHVMCVLSLAEAARDWCPVRIPVAYDTL